MENLSDYSRGHYEWREIKCRASSKKRKSYVRDFDEVSSTDKSKKSRSGDTKPPSEEIVESDPEWETDEYEVFSCDSGKGIGEEAQSEYENSDGDDLKPNHYHETAHTSEYQRSNWKAGAASPDPWIAECAHGTATLKWPVYSANHNQSPLQSHSIQKQDLYWRREEQNAQAQPLIRAAWAGDFIVHCDQEATRAKFEGLKGCLSSKACEPALWVVEQLPQSIAWEKLPRLSVWPKSFQRRGGPTDDDIAVFFFPSVKKHDTMYDSLLFDLIRDDMALRTTLMGSELLLFTSVELPPLFTRFQAKFYMWGVFRGNQPRL